MVSKLGNKKYLKMVICADNLFDAYIQPVNSHGKNQGKLWNCLFIYTSLWEFLHRFSLIFRGRYELTVVLVHFFINFPLALCRLWKLNYYLSCILSYVSHSSLSLCYSFSTCSSMLRNQIISISRDSSLGMSSPKGKHISELQRKLCAGIISVICYVYNAQIFHLVLW